MLIEGAGEVALQQLVVINGLGNDATHKLEVAEMVGVAVRRGIDGVSNSVPWRRLEKGIHGVEDLP